MRRDHAAYPRARAPALAHAAAAAARRSGTGGRAALAPRPAGEHRSAHPALRCRGCARGRQRRGRDRVLPRRAGGHHQRPAPRRGAQPVAAPFHRGRPACAFGARRRRRVRSGSGAAPRRGRREPGPGGHGGARGAAGRLSRAALGARTGHDIAGNIRAGPRRKGTQKLIRVVLADDHALVRAGIRSLLNAMHDVEVVGEAASGEEALEIASREQPDVVLMDIAMKGITGLEAAARMRDQHPGVRVIILSMHSGEEYVLQALRAGAMGYLLKDAATGELELGLRTVIRGESWLSPAVSRQVVEGYVQRVGGDAGPDGLTARPREVLRLVAGGKSTEESAFVLNLSGKTVETHRPQIMERLGIRDVAGLVRYALRTGLIPPEG